MNASVLQRSLNQPVRINTDRVELEGDLNVPEGSAGIVIFAHGSGSGRHSPRNQRVAAALREAGLGTLLFDLLTHEEELAEEFTGHLRFNIGLLAGRLARTAEWLDEQRLFPLGFFGASTGGGAALVAAAQLGKSISAVVSRGGRPDLAGAALSHVAAPTLLMVGALDERVLELNRQAYEQLRCEKQLHIVPGASHLFEEPGTLAEVADYAGRWFQKHFPRATME
jgi:putative phosphoribosyl transferase